MGIYLTKWQKPAPTSNATSANQKRPHHHTHEFYTPQSHPYQNGATLLPQSAQSISREALHLPLIYPYLTCRACEPTDSTSRAAHLPRHYNHLVSARTITMAVQCTYMKSEAIDEASCRVLLSSER